MRRRRRRRAAKPACDEHRIEPRDRTDPVVADALAGLAIAIPQLNRQPPVEEMLQAMNGGLPEEENKA